MSKIAHFLSAPLNLYIPGTFREGFCQVWGTTEHYRQQMVVMVTVQLVMRFCVLFIFWTLWGEHNYIMFRIEYIYIFIITHLPLMSMTIFYFENFYERQ